MTSTKHIHPTHTHNNTIDYDPCTSTTNEQHNALLFSIDVMNSTYSASVEAHCVDHKEHVTR